MSLRVWLPLKGDLNNYGTSSLKFSIINASNTTVNDNGKIGGQCYGNNSNTAGGVVSDSTINLGDNVSMFCWVKLNSFFASSSLTGILGQHRYGSNQGMGITMKYVSASTGYLSLNTGNGSGRTYNTYTGSTLLSSNTWYHVGFTYTKSTGEIKLYVNGNLDGTYTYANQKNVADYIQLYAWSFDSGSTIYNNYMLNGYLNDVRIYDHCLSVKEIKEISKCLILHYPLNSIYNMSDSCSDAAGFYNATTIGGTLTSTVDKDARSGQCMLFNNGSYLRTNDVLKNATEFSISVWLKPTVNQTGCIWNGRTTTGKAIAAFYLGGGIRFDDDGSLTQSSSITLNQWTHIVCTWKSGGQKKIYINASLNKNVSAGTNSHTNTKASIGMSQTGDGTPSGNQYRGYMSDYRIYATELTQTDVTNLYKDSIYIDDKQNLHVYELDERLNNTDNQITKGGELKTSLFSEVMLPVAITGDFDTDGNYTKIHIESDGSVWYHLFHHNAPASYRFTSGTDFTKPVYQNSGNTWFNMAFCNYLSTWEFLAVQKVESSSAETKWRWIQNVNPMIATWDQAKLANITKVDGYSSWATNYAGLFRYTSGTTPHDNTYLRQANATAGNWYGACGCTVLYNGGIPGFNGSVVKSGYMDVYVRIDNNSILDDTNMVRINTTTIQGNKIYEI